MKYYGPSIPPGRAQYLRFLIIAVALLTTLSVAVFWVLRGIQKQVNKRLASSLQTVLHATDKALQNWAEQNLNDLRVLASDDDLSDGVEAQLRLSRDRSALLHTPALESIRKRLGATLRTGHYVGFSVIAPDGFEIATSSDDAIGTRHIAEQIPTLLPRIMAGASVLELPHGSAFFLPGPSDRRYPVVPAATPIRDRNERVVAALVCYIDPQGEFTDTIRLGRFESTGETYAFDRDGRFLTETRFMEYLRNIGLVSPSESALAIFVRDPLGNIVEAYRPNGRRDLPLTQMARTAIQGQAGMDLNGYTDYRGAPVIGAWLWDSKLGMGLATEMEVAEAHAPARRIRILSVTMLLLIAAVMIALVIMVRQRAGLLAQEAVKAREELMSIVAHDLRNPINAIVVRSHILMGRLRNSGENEELRRQMESINRTAYQMNALLSDLTDLARLEAGRLLVELRESSLDETLQTAIDTIRPLMNEKDIQFQAQIAENLPRASIDRGRISQVLDNLLGNAVKFTPARGRIGMQVEPLDGKIQFCISDTGRGIPPEALPHVFEQHWQLRAGREGMGLGLFIAKTLVEAHQGQIWVQSAVNEGTKFYFTLPALESIPHNPTHPTSVLTAARV
ncbi:MAG: sensor histidine kinase [Acidobacteria bacterium]|nr:sensor histidine kinase [Acidobacteriota bacterium]